MNFPKLLSRIKHRQRNDLLLSTRFQIVQEIAILLSRDQTLFTRVLTEDFPGIRFFDCNNPE